MSLTVYLRGANGRLVEVTESGELAIAPLHYSNPVFQFMDLVDTAYNFFRPRAGEQLIITGMSAFANRNVTTQTQVDIYEASSASSLTIVKQIRQIDLAKLDNSPESGLNYITSTGAFINGKCDDDDVSLTISGYYIPQIGDGVVR